MCQVKPTILYTYQKVLPSRYELSNNSPIQHLIEGNLLGHIYAIQRNIYILSLCSFNLHSTGLTVWTFVCVVSVWVCKHCGNPRPGTVWSGIWGGTTSLPLSFNYGRRRREGGGAILMKMSHIIKVDLTRFIHSSGSRTVNTEIK